MIIVRFWWLISTGTNSFYAVTSSWLFSLGFVATFYHRQKCHSCWRPTWHPHKVAGTHWQTCHVHATVAHHEKLTAEHKHKHPHMHELLKQAKVV